MEYLKEHEETLWIKYRPLWAKWARTTKLPGYEREDLVQQSFILFKEALLLYDETKGVPFGAFYKLKLRQWLSHKLYHKEASVCAYELGDGVVFEEPIEEGIEDEVELRVLMNEIRRLLLQLDEKEVYIIEAFYFKRCSIKQIALTLNVKEKWVEYKKNRILKHLRKKL